MPFNVSNLVFYYNKKAFPRAGLDPEKPPATFDELRADAEKIEASGVVTKAGIGLKLDAWHLEQWLAKAGEPYVNNGNGRKARATKVEFDNKTGSGHLRILVRHGDATGSPRQTPPRGRARSTICSGSATRSHGDDDRELGRRWARSAGARNRAVPGRRARRRRRCRDRVGRAASSSAVPALYIVNKSAPAKQEAAWRFAKFLNEPQTQATWAAGTGYIPIREVGGRPRRRSSNDGPRTPASRSRTTSSLAAWRARATAGPVIGDYQGVRDAVLEAEQGMFTQGTKPATALNQARSNADEAISEYNSRIGA